jgi:DNA transposition AAA+ family ATPase
MNTTPSAPEPDDEPTQLRPATTTTNYNISPAEFEKVIGTLPDEQQDIIRWAYFLGKDRGWSLTKLANNLGSSSTVLSRVFRGTYGAELTNLCAALNKVRNSRHESVGNPDFIMTSLGNEIFTICDRVRALRTVAILWGAMGIGKTTVLEEYKRLNNHGKTIYFRCEPGMTLVQFITALAGACGIGYKSKQTQLRTREKLYSLLGAGQRLVIIDELHQLFLRRPGNDLTAVLQCEFLRTIYDKAGCGLVLTGTKALEKYMIDQKDALAQLLDRGTMAIHLPDKPTAEDGRTFVKAFGLPPLTDKEPEAAAIVKDILSSAGLRQFTLALRDGAATAAKRGEKYTWAHFCTTYEDFQSLGKRRK